MKNQITKTLPRTAWEKITIRETNEPLIEIKETSRIKIDLITKQYQQSFYVRQTIAEKILKISELLPKGINLVLIEGYRNMKTQQDCWNKIFNSIKEKNQHWDEDQINQQVGLFVAKPSPLANHHCGGAVDVTLAYANGTLLDMGTPYPTESISADYFKKFKMFSEEISWEQNKNRQILRTAMETEDFVWYPNEWWHYCWGDRMWAVYSNQVECFYGSIELP